MLWGEEQIANTANALQAQIGQLRRTLGATAIVTSEAGYALDIGPDDLDAARFEQLVAKGRRLLDGRGDGPGLIDAGRSPPAAAGGAAQSSSPTRASLTPSERTWTT